jgi:hypothetical protein
VISRFGVEASLRAIEELSAGDAAQRAALSSKLEQLEYEAKKTFEQYDAVDARNRLAAAELERRWNERLEEIQTVKERLSSLYEKRYSLSVEEEARIRLMGENFAEIWHSDRCPPTLKKMILRTAIEEIIVRTDAKKETLLFTIHWKGGAHTQLDMERPALSNRDGDADGGCRDHSSHGGSAWRRSDCIRVEPTRILYWKGKTVESEPCGHSPAQLFDSRPKESAARSCESQLERSCSCMPCESPLDRTSCGGGPAEARTNGSARSLGDSPC